MARPIDRAMRVQDILALIPHAEPLLAEYGLHCASCAGSSFETLEEGYYLHDFDEDRLEELVKDLNTLFERRPERPKEISVTEAAAEALAGILAAEGQENHYLVVGLDEAGGFCLEVLPDVPEDHAVFGHVSTPSLKLAASPLSLVRLGGATIDKRDGRFKLDLPGGAPKKGCACAGGGACGCSR